MAYHKTASPKLFDELRLAIMQGTYRPRERLMERELAKRYNVSRTPIREALRKLEGLGLVHIIPNQGAKVVDFSREDIENLYSFRLVLEQYAAKLACSTISLPELDSLAEINKNLAQAVLSNDFAQMVEFDQKFHLTLYMASRNPFLIKTIEEFRLKSSPLSYFFWNEKTDLRKSISEHTDIIKALKDKNTAKLKALLGKNLGRPKLRYLRYLSGNV